MIRYFKVICIDDQYQYTYITYVKVYRVIKISGKGQYLGYYDPSQVVAELLQIRPAGSGIEAPAPIWNMGKNHSWDYIRKYFDLRKT